MVRRLAALLVASATLFAQQPTAPAKSTPNRRPRIGLVLSGGSALGLSHIGVIRWLEEHRIPVDLVAGTSMGGLVGGLYSTGADAEAMRAFVSTTDWSVVFSSAAPFHELSYRRKEDRREFPNILELGLKHGISLPSGLTTGQEVGFVISRFAAPYGDMRSFDDLPTPFRCVATDLYTGSSVVLNQGDLGTALRATMSIPTFFAPVPYANGSQLLVDGGLLNNLPVDVAKSMGAEITIAVQLIDPPAKRNTITSLLNVASRSLSIIIDSNAKKSAQLADILIAPDYQGLGSTDFGKYKEFDARGYEAAEKMKDKLLPLTLNQTEYQQWLTTREQRRRPPEFTPDAVEVVGPSDPAITRDLKETFFDGIVGKPIDPKEVQFELNRMVGRGVYQSASYAYVRENNQDVLRIRTIPKPNAPPFINTGINIAGSEAGDTHFGFGARLTFLDIGHPGAEWRNDFTLGLNNSVTSEYYYLFKKRFFLAPRIYASAHREDLYSGNTRIYDLNFRENGFGGDIGVGGGRFNEVRLGYVFDNMSLRVLTGIPLEGFENQEPLVHTARLKWSWDSQDSNVVPRHGIHSVAEMRWNFWRNRCAGDQATCAGGLMSNEQVQFGTIEERFSIPKTFGNRYILLGSVSGGTTMGPKAPFPPFSLGGPLRMSAFGFGQLRGDHYYYGGATSFVALSGDPLSSLNRTYLTVGVETANAFHDISEQTPFYDGFAGITAETRVGALVVGGAFGNKGNHRFFFSLGRIF
jgi:NTE family protein